MLGTMIIQSKGALSVSKFSKTVSLSLKRWSLKSAGAFETPRRETIRKSKYERFTRGRSQATPVLLLLAGKSEASGPRVDRHNRVSPQLNRGAPAACSVCVNVTKRSVHLKRGNREFSTILRDFPRNPDAVERRLSL